jgi:hypothetical protein
VRVLGVERAGDCWVISAAGPEVGSCPGCLEASTRRHSRYFRYLQDLPAQGATVGEDAGEPWRCLNRKCERQTFTDQLPEIVCPRARRTQRIAQLVHLFGHNTGGRPAEWLQQHPEVEIVSRDRCGLYAQGAREGTPQARQVADRFHLLQNLRETIETQLSRTDRSTGRALLPEPDDEGVVTISKGPSGPGEVAEHRHLTRQAHRRSRQAIFDQIHTLREAGTSIGDIARQTGFGPRSIRKWLKFSTPPERRATAPKPCSPNYFLDYLSRRWAEGCARGRELLQEIKALRLYQQLLPSGAAPGEVATRQRLQSRDVASDSRAKDSPDYHGGLLRCRSRDRVVHLADRRGFAMHQAAWVVDAASGRRSEKRLGGLHRHASARHAIPRDSSKQRHSEILRLAR